MFKLEVCAGSGGETAFGQTFPAKNEGKVYSGCSVASGIPYPGTPDLAIA